MLDIFNSVVQRGSCLVMMNIFKISGILIILSIGLWQVREHKAKEMSHYLPSYVELFVFKHRLSTPSNSRIDVREKPSQFLKLSSDKTFVRCMNPTNRYFTSCVSFKTIDSSTWLREIDTSLKLASLAAKIWSSHCKFCNLREGVECCP